MGPIVRTFSYNDSIIVSKALNADNKENGENKLQDEMDVESDNDDNNEIYRPSEFAIYKENGNQRFGQIRSIVSVNDELQIKIQQIYTYDELPNNFHCHSRMNTRESQLWLVDQYLEESSIIASTNEIVRKIDITIVRDSTIITDGLFIKTILYKNNGHWKLRDATLDYMHPCEYSVLNPPPPQYNNL
ncbi:17637_t:CDS:2 [Rhizophagus irregularis]|nr:17637_t:CDS:2 [Rhizophagus irregularis]